jgi:hypothetical protein
MSVTDLQDTSFFSYGPGFLRNPLASRRTLRGADIIFGNRDLAARRFHGDDSRSGYYFVVTAGEICCREGLSSHVDVTLTCVDLDSVQPRLYYSLTYKM